MPTSTNRKYFFVGLNTGLVTDGLPDERCCRFYARRSNHGLYCSIVGNVVIPGGVPPNQRTPTISDSPAWTRLAEAIALKGAIPGIQLATAWKGYTGQKKFVSRSSAGEIAHYKQIAGEISAEDIRSLFQSVREGTELAVSAGFRHIQLHAAHGYLFSLLVDGRIYPRAEAVLDAISEWIGQAGTFGIETSLRFSLRTGDNAFDENGRDEFLNAINSLPVDYLDASSGFYDVDKRLIYPSVEGLLRQRRRDTLALANRYMCSQFIYSGKSTRGLDSELPENIHIGICRDLIANPDYLKNSQTGCANMMKCHWYSRGKEYIICGRWRAENADGD
jgi:2,4-dienoyl-CoA reductase-like NADH-dependent reductase (Old Yellow Enzyme family)